MTGNETCDFFIEIITWWSNNTSYSFGEICILLFIILQPAFIVFYFVTTMCALLVKKKKIKILLWIVILLTFLIALSGVFLFIATPVFDIATDMRY